MLVRCFVRANQNQYENSGHKGYNKAKNYHSSKRCQIFYSNVCWLLVQLVSSSDC